MDWYTTIKRYYDMGIYKLDKNDLMYVGKFVVFGKITEQEFNLITNEIYTK